MPLAVHLALVFLVGLACGVLALRLARPSLSTPEGGHRKLVAFVVYVAAVLMLALTAIVSAMAYDALTWGFGLYVGGNGVEHWTKRAPKAAPGAAP